MNHGSLGARLEALRGATQDPVLNDTPHPAEHPTIWPGVLFWTLFCCLVVAVRGAFWDEHAEFAQVMLRHVPYPEAHPLFRCTRGALNLQVFTSAAILHLTSSPLAVCAFRNVVFLMATVLPVFLIATALSKRTLAGHLAVLLILMGIHEAFDGCYRMNTWYFYSSTGHVGRGYALVVLGLLLGRRWRTGLFLLGLMPCVHIGQMPVLFGLSCLLLPTAWRSDERADMVRGIPWLLVGFAVCGLLWLSKAGLAVSPPTEGPYFSNADPKAVWTGYLAQDLLRALPGRGVKYTNSFIILGAALWLTAAAAWLEFRDAGRDKTWRWVFVYVLGCAAAVWGIMAIRLVLGDRTPYLLVAWMPNRFSNHAAIIALACLPAVLLSRPGEASSRAAPAGALMMTAALAYGVLRPALAAGFAGPLYDRYFAMGDGLTFFLIGGAVAVLLLRLKTDRVPYIAWLAITVVGFAAVTFTHQFGACAAACGFATSLVLHRLKATPPAVHVAGALLGVGLILVLIAGQWRARVGEIVTSTDRAVIAHLEAEGEPDAMIVARPDQFTLQARIGHPVLCDHMLDGWIPYMPSLGPAIQKIRDDLYGIRYERGENAVLKPWTEVWTSRTRDEWQDLADEYEFRHVISPAQVPLDLDEVLRGAGPTGTDEILYHVPVGVR